MVGSAIERHYSLHDNRGFHCERSPPIMATSKAAGLDPIERCETNSWRRISRIERFFGEQLFAPFTKVTLKLVCIAASMRDVLRLNACLTVEFFENTLPL